jgi:dTDP-4-dehydrorhamnose reductase
VYHAGAEGCCTWFDLARAFLRRLGVEKSVRPCPTSDYPTPAVRPRNSILANRRLKKAGLNLMRPWKEDLDEFVGAFREELLREAGET